MEEKLVMTLEPDKQPDDKETLAEAVEWVVEMMNTSTPRREDVYPSGHYHGD